MPELHHTFISVAERTPHAYQATGPTTVVCRPAATTTGGKTEKYPNNQQPNKSNNLSKNISEILQGKSQ